MSSPIKLFSAQKPIQYLTEFNINSLPVGGIVHSQHMHHMHKMRDHEQPHKHRLHNPVHTHNRHSIDLDPSVVPSHQVSPRTI